MLRICQHLEKAFSLMHIMHKRTLENEKISYQLQFPETSIFFGTTNMIIDKMFSAELNCFAAKGISPDLRSEVLARINELNQEFQFVKMVMDKNGDVYSCQQFILVGNEEIMCKQIVTNLVAFYDLHKRAAQKIPEALHNP